MSQEIINVLNYLGEQLGIAIDWTSDNIWPQVMDILGRYRILEIIITGLWVFVEIFMIITSIVIFTKMAKGLTKFKNTKEDNFWWHKAYSTYDMTGFGGVLLVIGIISVVLGVVFIFPNIRYLFEWIIVPEIKYLEMLKGLMA